MAVRTADQRTVAGLHVTIWSGTGPIVVALPGLSSTACVWEPFAGSLPDAHIVGLDLRGRGGSVSATGEPGLRAHARDVAAVITELDLTDVVVVGHSMGAYLAPVVAQEAGDRVAKVVCIDGGIRPALPPFMRPALVRMAFRRQLRKGDREWPDVASFARAGGLDKMASSRPDLKPVILEMLRQELGGGVGPLRPRIDIDRAVADAVDAFFGPDVEPALDALKVPTDVFLASNMKRDGQKPFIADKAVASWLKRQPLLNVKRLPGNHVTVLFAPEILAAIAP
jgi:pimeloyl-ACP methyl ester carboxylesterase